jgi:hypothetical protein
VSTTSGGDFLKAPKSAEKAAPIVLLESAVLQMRRRPWSSRVAAIDTTTANRDNAFKLAKKETAALCDSSSHHHSAATLRVLVRQWLSYTHLGLLAVAFARRTLARPKVFHAVHQNLHLFTELGLDGQHNHENTKRDCDHVQLAVLIAAICGHVRYHAVNEVDGREHEQQLGMSIDMMQAMNSLCSKQVKLADAV